MMPLNLGEVVNERRSIPASAFSGRSRSSTQLLMEAAIWEPWNNSSNQVCRRMVDMVGVVDVV